MLLFTLLTRVLISSDATIFGRTGHHQPGNRALGWARSWLLTLLVGSVVGALAGTSALLAPEPGPVLASSAAPLLARLDPALHWPRALGYARCGAQPASPTDDDACVALRRDALAVLLLALFLVHGL